MLKASSIMTTTSNLLDVVRHYQRSIERHQEDEARLLHCITKLYNLPVKVEHLQETGIGKTVNSLRKFNGEVGVAAKTLVTKWKAMVAAEEEPSEVNGKDNVDIESTRRRSSDDDQDESKQNTVSSGDEQQEVSHSSKPKDRHHKSHHQHNSKSSSEEHSKSKQKSSSSHHQHNNNSKKHREEKVVKPHRNSRDKRKHENQHLHSSCQTSEEKHIDEIKTHRQSSKEKKEGISNSQCNHISNSNEKEKKHRSKKLSPYKEQTSKTHKDDKPKREKHLHKTSTIEKEQTKCDKSKEHKYHHKGKTSNKSEKHSSTKIKSESNKSSDQSPKQSQSTEDNSGKAKTSKLPTKRKRQYSSSAEDENDDIDGFDSSMGANFADVLGMLEMPMSSKKMKKSLNKLNGSVPPSPATISATAANSSSLKINAGKSTSSSLIKNQDTVRTSDASTYRPELLSSTVKLEPLDPSIALELPTISNNYKPLPFNQAMMDVIYNTGNSCSSNSAQKPPRAFNESQALQQGISSKTIRTKIYSGAKPGQIIQAPTLFDLCTRVLQKNIDALEYTGGVPFDVLRPVLERATPEQLLIFEDYNPYLMEDSDVLWKQHAQRHYRTQRRQEMESWREMFLRCQEEKDRKLSILAESIKQQQKINEAPVRKTQLAFVDSMVKPPRNILKKQEQYGTKTKLTATPAARVAALSNVIPNAVKPGDNRLRALARDITQIAVAPLRPKKAPLMVKTLQLMRGRLKR